MDAWLAVLLCALVSAQSDDGRQRYPRLQTSGAGQSWYQGSGATTSASMNAPSQAQPDPQPAAAPAPSPSASPQPAPAAAPPPERPRPRAIAARGGSMQGPVSAGADDYSSRSTTGPKPSKDFPLTPFDQVAPAKLGDAPGPPKSECKCRKGFQCKCKEGMGLVFVNGQWGCCQVGSWYSPDGHQCYPSRGYCTNDAMGAKCYQTTPD